MRQETSRGRAGIIVLVAIIVVAAVAWMLVGYHSALQPRSVSPPAPPRQGAEAVAPQTESTAAPVPEPAAALTTEAEPAPESSDATADALSPALEKTKKRADYAVGSAEAEQSLEGFWASEDAVLETMPKYDDVKAEYRKKAEDLLKPIDPHDNKAILALAQGEIDAFWDNGSLASASSYEHGYLARAILELAVEGEPDNYQRLTFLKEAIGTTTPLFFAGPKRNPDAYKALWPVVDKQKQLVMAGKIPVSPEAMLAMYDWATVVGKATGDDKAPVEGWQWLVDNADQGGWGKIKHLFIQGLECAKKGDRWGMNLYACPNDIKNGQPDFSELRRNGRRLSSLQGSKWYREHAVRVWEDYDKLSHGPE